MLSKPGAFVVTDSSCDLEQDEIDPFNIEIVPLTVRFGSEDFTDRQDLSVEDFYQRMANTEDLPQTSCPSAGAFEQPFRKASGAGAEAVVCLNISSDLSTTLRGRHLSTPTRPVRRVDERGCGKRDAARHQSGMGAARRGGRHGSSPGSAIPGQNRPADQYFVGCTRDFFAVMAKTTVTPSRHQLL